MHTIPSRDVLVRIVSKELAASKLRDAVVYVFKNLLTPEVTHDFGRKTIEVSKPSVLLFIDLVPMANWSHECLYVVYDGENTSVTEASFPPDGEDLLVLQKPEDIENWVLLSQEFYR